MLLVLQIATHHVVQYNTSSPAPYSSSPFMLIATNKTIQKKNKQNKHASLFHRENPRIFVRLQASSLTPACSLYLGTFRLSFPSFKFGGFKHSTRFTQTIHCDHSWRSWICFQKLMEMWRNFDLRKAGRWWMPVPLHLDVGSLVEAIRVLTSCAKAPNAL